MAIKSIKSEGPPPIAVAIAYNGDGRFMEKVRKDLNEEWGIVKCNWVHNKLMPKNSAIIYDRYDQIAVNTINGEVHYRKITKEERDAAYFKASHGNVSDPFQDEKN